MSEFLHHEVSIRRILEIYRGHSHPGEYFCSSRISDCFVYILSGEATYYFPEKTAPARPGDILFLAYRSQYHHTVTTEDYRFLVINFFFDRDGAPHMPNDVLSGEALRATETYFWRALQSWTRGGFPQRIECLALLYQIYAKIVANETLGYLPKEKFDRLRIAVHKMEEEFGNTDLSVPDLAKAAGMSEVHFRRQFHQIYRTSPQKYLQDLRIRQAKLLLAGEELSIAEISDRCGFSSAYYFARVFRTATGMPPREYRQFLRSS